MGSFSYNVHNRILHIWACLQRDPSHMSLGSFTHEPRNKILREPACNQILHIWASHKSLSSKLILLRQQMDPCLSLPSEMFTHVRKHSICDQKHVIEQNREPPLIEANWIEVKLRSEWGQPSCCVGLVCGVFFLLSNLQSHIKICMENRKPIYTPGNLDTAVL